LGGHIIQEKISMQTKHPLPAPDHQVQQTALLKAFFGTTRHYFGNWNTLFAGVQDPRNPKMITYPLDSLLFTGVFLFACRLGSRRGVQAKLRENGPSQAKFGALFGVENVPHGDTLNYGYRRLKVEEVQEVICRCVEGLIRKKALLRYRLLGVYYLVAIDGTGVITFRERHCEHCLKKTTTNGETTFYHPVLEAKLVTSNGFAFSLMTEFIENTDLSADKQDCELKAFYRLSKRLKARFPRLSICLLLDGLYAGGPTFKLCEDNGWKYMIVLREDDLPNVNRSYAAVLPHSPKNHKQLRLGKQGQTVQDYAWAESLDYTDTQNNQHSLNVLECLESKPNAEGQIETTHYKWLTNFTLTSYNVDRLANQGGRLRWKIENEGFNIQKNSELYLEHSYSKDPTAHKIFYLLLQLGHLIFQLMEKGNLLQKDFPNGWGAARNLAFRLLEAWRNLVISAADLLRLGEGKYQIRFSSS
jgi:hypothetical protein